MYSILSIILFALGNRAWGFTPAYKIPGLAIMTYAAVLGHPYLWMFAPLIAVVLCGVRIASPEPLLKEESGTITWSAIERAMIFAAYPMTIGAINLYFGHFSAMPVIITLLIPLIAVFYWLAGKQSRVDATALAELLTGAYLGLA